MTAITAAIESCRSGDANWSVPSAIAPHRNVAVVDARAIQTRCMSSNTRPMRARSDSWFSAHIRPTTPGARPAHLVGRRRRRGHPQETADVLELGELAGTRRAVLDVTLERDHLADRQLAIVEGCQTPPHRRAGQQPHTSLNSARRASRALARRDFTVPTAIPSENPISS